VLHFSLNLSRLFGLFHNPSSSVQLIVHVLDAGALQVGKPKSGWVGMDKTKAGVETGAVLGVMAFANSLSIPNLPSKLTASSLEAGAHPSQNASKDGAPAFVGMVRVLEA